MIALVAAVASFGLPAGADPVTQGARLIIDAEKGNCTICHAIPGLGVPPDAQGNIGPPLDGIGGFRTVEELQAIITDPRRTMPQTIMPAYGVTAGLTDLAAPFQGKPILTDDEIANIAAYLASLS